MNIKQYIIENLTWIITVPITGLLSWFFIKKPYQKKDLTSKDIHNNASSLNVITQNLDVYQRMFKDLDDQLIKANMKINQLEEELELIRKHYKELRNKYDNENSK